MNSNIYEYVLDQLYLILLGIADLFLKEGINLL
jgi:hypothetical protein